MEEMVEIVDEEDNVVGRATRKDAHRKNLLHRLAHVVVENSKGEILVLTRARNIEVWPGWKSNVGGHVDSGENYETAARRELFEEIGIRGKLENFGKVLVRDGKYSHMTACFKAKSNGPFKADKSEIWKMEFKSLEKIRKEIAGMAKYTPTFLKAIEHVYGEEGDGEIVDLINEKDEVSGKATREEVKHRRLLYRCAGVYVKMNGKVVVERRAARKEIRPGNWSIVEETLHSGETFEQAARRGVKEELGLEASDMKLIGKKIIRDERYPDNFMLGVFVCEAKGKMRPQKTEVDKVRLMSVQQLQKFLAKEEGVSPGLSQTFWMLRAHEEGVTVSAPGKLMLSGEWSVLEGAPCIVLAVDRRVYAKAKESPTMSVNLRDFNIKTKAWVRGGKVEFAKRDERLVFTGHALETALNYLWEGGAKTKTFSLETSSDISAVRHRGKKMKAGFGSSAAAVVAITGAVLKLHGIGIETRQEKENLFKLGVIAHYKAQGKIGSGFDVAASTFGGALAYRRFDAKWLEAELGRLGMEGRGQGKGITEVVRKKWPGFAAHPVSVPEDFRLLVGFTGKSASTTELVKKVRIFREMKPRQYNAIIGALRRTTHKMVVALEMGSHSQILKLIVENRALLKGLSDASAAGLETKEHAAMVEGAHKYGAAAKFSGAGGGDCGIGICFDGDTARKVLAEWKRKGIVPVDVKVSEEGARVEA